MKVFNLLLVAILSLNVSFAYDGYDDEYYNEDTECSEPNCITLTGARNSQGGCNGGWIPIVNSTQCGFFSSSTPLCLKPCAPGCKHVVKTITYGECTTRTHECSKGPIPGEFE